MGTEHVNARDLRASVAVSSDGVTIDFGDMTGVVMTLAGTPAEVDGVLAALRDDLARRVEGRRPLTNAERDVHASDSARRVAVETCQRRSGRDH